MRTTWWTMLALLAASGGAAAQHSGRSLTFTAAYALGTGGSSETIQDARLGLLSAEYVFTLVETGAWSLEYPITGIPLLVLRGNPLTVAEEIGGRWYIQAGARTGTAYGVGLSPGGLRVVRRWDGASVFAGGMGGIVGFDKPAPARNARQFNFLGEVEVGVRVPVSLRHQLVVAYRWNHISNGGTAEINPGIDSHLFSVGMRIR